MLMSRAFFTPYRLIIVRHIHCEASTSPLRNARRARTSVTYCSASRTGIRCRRSLSVGSLIQPSMGIALSTIKMLDVDLLFWGSSLTFMEYIAQRAVIKYHDPG